MVKSIWAIALLCPSLALAQIYKCADAGGKTTFTDTPCANSQTATPITLQPASGKAPPTPKPAMSAEAVEHEQKRAEMRRQRQETQATIDASTQKIRQIRAENHDPAKCQAARARMQQIEKRSPLAKSSLDYFEYQQKASLYCGN